MALSTKSRRGTAPRTIFGHSVIDLASATTDTIDVTNDIGVPGVEVGDVVLINWDNETAKLAISAYVSASGVVTVVAQNPTSGTVNAASSNFYYVVFCRN